MSMALRLLFSIALIGSISSSIYCLMVIAAAVRFGMRKRREDHAPADFLPAISVFKPLHGTEPGLERNLETFFEQAYPLVAEGAKHARRIKSAAVPHHDRRLADLLDEGVPRAI